MRKFLPALLFSLIILNATAQTNPKRELRGDWISTHLSLDWPNRLQSPEQQRQALVRILDHDKETGINAAFFQVRSQADAMYASTLEPWSYYLTNNQGTAPTPFWDPLQFAIEETHKRGIEFHAWINPYRAVANTANANNPAQYAPTHVSKTHPEWMLTVGTVRILNPGLPEVRDHVTNVIVDIVKRYDVDGIHFDDYFYPNGTIGDDATYAADPRGFPNTTAGRADWRRDNVNLLIKRVNDSIQALKPWVKFGVSPSGIYRSSTNPAIGSPTSAGALQHYTHLFADTRKWIQEGWVDYLAPQVYWFIGQTGSDYKLLVPWWNNNGANRHIYIGMADYKVNTTGWGSRSEIPNQVRLNRSQPNVFGQIHFRHAFLEGNLLNYRDSLKTRFYNTPALLPLMPWKDSIPPAAVTQLALRQTSENSIELSWTSPGSNNELDRVRRYAIYRSTSPEINVEDPAQLYALTNTDVPSFTDAQTDSNGTYFYLVTAIDRLNNESAPSQVVSNDRIKPTVVVRNITRSLEDGTVSIRPEDIDAGSTDNWGIDSMVLSQMIFDCSSIGENTVTLTVTDKAGNSASASATVTINGKVPEPAISISRVDNTYTGLAANTIALGYGAQSLVLAASNRNEEQGQTSYIWSPVDGLGDSSSATTNFTPTKAGTYMVTVEATNESGCKGSTNAIITVIDARCDDGKVILCKHTQGNVHPICVSPNAVPAQLQNGAHLGTCDSGTIVAAADQEGQEPVLKAYPNPVSSHTSLTFKLNRNERNVALEVYDMNGSKVSTVYQGAAEANRTYTFPVDATSLQGQFFNVRLVTSEKVHHFRLVRE